MSKVNYRKLAVEIIEEQGIGIEEGTKEFDAAVLYVKENWKRATNKDHAKAVGLTTKQYAMGSIGNGLQDGKHSEFMTDEQEIIEVDQEEVKKALRILTTRENDFLGFLYKKWEEYNALYFYGQLSHPLITIDKMSNKTLGSYTSGENALGITNHIRFNRNFIALNQGEDGEATRILETLRHEMIHQWQDEVLYMKEGVQEREITVPAGFGSFLDKQEPKKVRRKQDDSPVSEIGQQKKRPKDWHNRDFKEYAVVVGIPAKGDKCVGNPADMPEAKSYNRKFTCECIASNGHPLTIWSTRTVRAICTVCERPYIEQKKAGTTVKVTLSHIEAPGVDMVEAEMKKRGYDHFEKFPNKKEKDAFVEALYTARKNSEGLEVEQGVYQKGHNAYKDGYTHWVAYSGEEVKPEKPKAQPKAVNKMKKADTKEKPAPAKKAAPQVAAAPKKNPTTQKKAAGKIVPFKKPKKATKGTAAKARQLLETYKNLGSIKDVADHYKLPVKDIIAMAKEYGVNFKEGVIEK